MSEGVLHEGASLRDALKVRAERGDYGPGDPDVLLENRVQSYIDREIRRTEDRVPGGRIMEVFRAPIDGGGTVITGTLAQRPVLAGTVVVRVFAEDDDNCEDATP